MAIGFSKEDMANLLITAWEGGSNYWVDYADYKPPKGMTLKELRKAAWEAAPEKEKDLWKDEGPEGRWPLYSLLPFLPPSVKWKIEFRPQEEEESVFLTPENMREAAQKLVETHPSIFARIKEGDYDAGDADVWLQTALFNEVVYG